MKETYKNINNVYCNSMSWEALKITIEKLNPSKIFILVDENTKEHCLSLFLNLRFPKIEKP